MKETKNLRYFEHNLLPRMFYENGEYIFNAIKEQKTDFIINALSIANSSISNYKFPYSSDAFSFSHIHCFDSECDMLWIQMPERDEITSCRSVYMVWDKDWKNQFYYTVERSTDGFYAFCGWTADHSWLMFNNEVPVDSMFESRDIEQLFTELDTYRNLPQELNKQYKNIS